MLYVHAAELMFGQDPFRVMRCFGFLAGWAVRMGEYIPFVNITNLSGKHCCFDIPSSYSNKSLHILYTFYGTVGFFLESDNDFFFKLFKF